MSRFAFPSSSPPSTPGPDGQTPDFQRRPPLFSILNDEHPSTTPAGPPPSSAHSFTPAGLPPSSVFGSSELGTGVSKLQFNKPQSNDAGIFNSPAFLDSVKEPPRTKNGTPAKPFGSSKHLFAADSPPSNKAMFGSPAYSESLQQSARTKNGTPAKPFSSNMFKVPSSTPDYSPAQSRRMQQSRMSEGDEDEDDLCSNAEDDDDMVDTGGFGKDAARPAFREFTSINGRNRFKQGSSMLGRSTQASALRSKFGASGRKGIRGRRPTALPKSSNSSVIPGIASDLISRSKDAPLTEPDDLIIGTEEVVSQASQAVEERGLLPEVTDDILSRASAGCLGIWSKYAESYSKGELENGLGPGETASMISKATFLSSLLLSLHHPPLQQTQPRPGPRSTNRGLAIVPYTAPKAKPLAKVLLDWLDKYHLDVSRLLGPLDQAQPNATASDLFWETIIALLLRAKFREVIQIFHEADFRYASSAIDDGEPNPGYHGAQLQSVQSVVGHARQILEASPAVRHDDWQINNAEWSVYRKSVESELDNLKDIAEGSAGNDDDFAGSFQAENFGVRDMSRNLSQSTRRAQSNVPWTVYQSLKVFYNILLGSTAELIAQSQDWLEASLVLTIWWDGTQDEDIATWSLNVSRQSLKPGGAALYEDPYLGRLSAAFLAVTDPDSQDAFQINSMSLLEVSMASVLQGNIEGALGSLKTWSLAIASAVAEIGALGGWVRSASVPKPAGLDEDDLMVLSYGQQDHGITKDDILLGYAEALFEREELQYNDIVKEGWELAILIVNRLDNQELAKETISRLLDELRLDSQDRMDKLITLCTELGLEDQARSVSERFADHLMSTTTLYGPAMICYARAHATQKLRTLISLLVSYSLVSSIAYPLESELDPSLSALLHTPRSALSNLAEVDPESASLLQFHLAGYASLRKFYNLRDSDFLPSTQNHPRPLARARLAAKYLTAVISSAADPIYGGLYDPHRESAVQVDCLLPLLGEASALLQSSSLPAKLHNRGNKRIFTKSQIHVILSAIEDIETVNQRVFDASRECFDTTLKNYANKSAPGGAAAASGLPSDPRALMKKSISSLSNNTDNNSGANSASNFSFSLMGSELLERSSSSAGGAGSKVDDIRRGWDWRQAFARSGTGSAAAANIRVVLDTLRRGLAGELAACLVRGGE